MNKINLIGIGFRPLDKKAGETLKNSDVVLANNRLLDVFKNYAEYGQVKERIIVHDSVYETIDYIRDNYREKRLSLLSAGDPMFFGIGRLIAERFGSDAMEVFPDISSIQAAFSRIRVPSNNALLMSLHGGPNPSKRRKSEYELSDLPMLVARHNNIAILTDRVNNPSEIAKAVLISPHPPTLKIYVCERLGYDNERITSGTPLEISAQSFEHPNVVIITGDSQVVPKQDKQDKGESPDPGINFGLKEIEIKHSKGLITKDEIRAVTIHKLRLLQRGVFWDIGAGSGSVSIETARLFPSLRVFAIERNGEQCKYINENKEIFGTGNVELIQGEAPDALKALPAPDRVFIGGNAGRLDEIVTSVSKLMPGGIIVINAATIETLSEAIRCLEKNSLRVNVTEVSVSRSKLLDKKRHLSALNPVFIIRGEQD